MTEAIRGTLVIEANRGRGALRLTADTGLMGYTVGDGG